MWRCEWIWQTYCWVRLTSFALGLVTTILCCSWWGSSACMRWQAGREREISARMMARIGETFIVLVASYLFIALVAGECPGVDDCRLVLVVEVIDHIHFSDLPILTGEGKRSRFAEKIPGKSHAIRKTSAKTNANSIRRCIYCNMTGNLANPRWVAETRRLVGHPSTWSSPDQMARS